MQLKQVICTLKIKKKQIIYMPRKNSRDSSIVTQLLLHRGLPDGWSIKSLDACSHTDVARHMSESSSSFHSVILRGLVSL